MKTKDTKNTTKGLRILINQKYPKNLIENGILKAKNTQQNGFRQPKTKTNNDIDMTFMYKQISRSEKIEKFQNVVKKLRMLRLYF